MTFVPSPKQALFLWKMICAEKEELRQPKLSEAKPALDVKRERKPLVDNNFLEEVRRGRATHLMLTDKAWVWAAKCSTVELVSSKPSDEAITLQGLLRRLIPLLKQRDIPLADLFQQDKGKGAGARVERADHAKPKRNRLRLDARITAVCKEITHGDSNKEVRLTALRAKLGHVTKSEVDAQLIKLHDAGRIALYRDDNTAAVSAADARDALMVGDSPRHLLYLKG